ncbi:hypothetical protein M422DRAFT_41182 [Sphaerobolus stellatus SS14]|nr:hypothetical protein M422DRAFT_41182 [Sphaerobolus stellatus SS14]
MEYVLVKTDYRKQWRHSSYGNYWIHRLSDHTTHALSERTRPSKIAYATWSPTGNAIAFVKENDLYVVPSADALFASPASDHTLRITHTGTSSLFFGVPDWVYEEEVFSSDFALWWSPSSTHIAFLSLDESKVPDYTFPVYNPTYDSSLVHPYTEFMTMKYPKPGYPNPIVGVLLLDLEGAKNAGVNSGEGVEEWVKEVDWEGRMRREDEVIMEVAWVANSTVVIKEVNRSADEGRVVVVDVSDSNSGGGKVEGKVVRRLGKEGEEGDEGWIDIAQTVYRLPESLALSSGAYLDIIPNKAGFNQIALFNPSTTAEPKWITSSRDEVTKLLTVDVERRLVYYMTASDAGIGRKLHSASIPTSNDAAFVPSTALTDDGLSTPSYYDVSISPQGGFYLLSYNGPHVPWQKLIKVGEDGFERVYTLNERLNKTVHEYQAPEIVYSTISNDGYVLNTREIRPPSMDTSGRTKYPVLFDVYGGPGSQKVDTQFRRDWHHFLACTLNYVVVSVDGRGTGFKGRALRRVVKGNLGYWETVDQIEGARVWAAKAYIDPERVGVWGWSYGGFMAAKVVEANAGVHTLAMSVAPVISWRMYDTIYTERYMGLPDENPEGYLNASITNVLPFNGFNYLLAHGSGDDNVHFANTAHMIDMFTQHQVRGYEFRMFTDSDHSISTRNANREIYEFMTTFLTSHWGKNGARLAGQEMIKEIYP